MNDLTLKPCPFCGGPADFEEVTYFGTHVSWTCGCKNMEVDCIGTQMISTFSRKEEAAEAWNKRAPLSSTPSDDLSKLAERLPEIKQLLRMQPDYVGTRDKTLAWIDDAATAIRSIRDYERTSHELGVAAGRHQMEGTIRSLTEERDRLRDQRDYYKGRDDEGARIETELRTETAALTARVRELEAHVQMPPTKGRIYCHPDEVSYWASLPERVRVLEEENQRLKDCCQELTVNGGRHE